MVSDNTIKDKDSKQSICNVSTLNELIAKFWNFEEVSQNKAQMIREEKRAEKHLCETYKRASDGRFNS